MKFYDDTRKGPAEGSAFNYALTALFLGAVWGFFEVFFKDVMSMGGRPFASAIMTGTGMLLMAVGYGMFRRAGAFFLITMCAVATRMIVIPVLGCSPMCRANAALALTLLGAATAVTFAVKERMTRNWKAGGVAAGAGVLCSGAVYYYAGMACAPCQYLKNFVAQGGLSTFMSVEVIWWGLFAAVMYYPGYLAGERLRGGMDMLRESRPVPYYAALVSASVIMICVTGFVVMP